MLSHFDGVLRFAILWTVAHQAPLSKGFSRQEYWSELPFPFPGDLNPLFCLFSAIELTANKLHDGRQVYFVVVVR